ncbi:MAG: transporter [Pseudoduganella sp.]|jgi:outer membrane protein TolC|nr:transporter [Pseudoduganella sp.]
MLAQPLAVDGAVEIALGNYTALHAASAEVCIAEADYAQASRLRNPGLRFNRLHDGEQIQFESVVGLDIAGLATRGRPTGLEMARFEQAQIRVAQRAVTLAAETRRSYFTALAARQKAAALWAFSRQADDAIQQAHLRALENTRSEVDYGRERALRGELNALVAKAEQRALAAQEELGRLMGLRHLPQPFVLLRELPALPQQPCAHDSAAASSIEQRLEVLAATRQVQATAAALGLVRVTRFINVSEVGYGHAAEADAYRAGAYQVALELPLFDFGGVRVVRAEAIYMRALHRAADGAKRAWSELRETGYACRAAHALARSYLDDAAPQPGLLAAGCRGGGRPGWRKC